MRFLIFDRFRAEDPDVVVANCTEPCIWITINDPGEKTHRISFRSGMIKDHLSLSFYDVEDVDGEGIWKNQAKLVCEFVKKNIEQHHIGLICCACEAGVSRSAATALALHRILNPLDTSDLDINPNHGKYPNQAVLHTIISEWKRLGF